MLFGLYGNNGLKMATSHHSVSIIYASQRRISMDIVLLVFLCFDDIDPKVNQFFYHLRQGTWVDVTEPEALERVL